jgi:NADH-quinone oxidoreductase subunit G
MTRCIQCTRCIRFGQEIAGVMELGMKGRGETEEIVTFVGKTVDSELSGNMIDICPVGALTSKPFRYTARTWELSRRKSVSPHDALGSNLIVQVKGDRVMRVLPRENEAINECWLSDRDRFSYEGLNSDERLTEPMIRRAGADGTSAWQSVDWQTALEHIAAGLSDVVDKHGGASIGALVAPHATTEEMALAAKLVRGLGSDNIDYRLRQSDFRGDGGSRGESSENAPIAWLGMPVAELSALDRVLVVGSFLRKDHPLVAARLRVAAHKGLRVSMVNPVADDWLMPIAAKAIASPSQLPRMLAEVIVACAKVTGAALPAELAGIEPSAEATAVADSLTGGKNTAILLGNLAEQHRDASQLFALAGTLARITGARLGCLTESANSIGAEIADARPRTDGLNAQAMLDDPRKAYLILHAEPEFDCANPLAARAALEKADFVVVMSPFKHAASYADVLLPVAPFTETAGTFVNCEGRMQKFNGVVKPLKATRPAWKVLRVLGTMLGVPGFEFESIDDVRASVLPTQEALDARLSNRRATAIASPAPVANGIERVADVPIYFSDAIVRRAASLQRTADARAPRARMHRSLFDSLGLAEGAQVKVKQGRGEAVLSAVVDPGIPPGVVAVAAAHPSTCHLEGMTGPVTVERA